LVGLNRQFLSAYVTASSNPNSYGKITVLRLPTNTQSQGPVQVQNTMISSTKVSSELSILRQNSTTVRYGNLLTLPVGKTGLLYVEPVYLQRSGQSSSFPQLARVLVSFNGQVGYASTLAGALDQVFGSGAGSGTTPPADGRTPSTSPSPTPTTTPPPTTSSPPPGATLSQAQAVANLNSALAAVKGAQASGDLGALGAALTKLDAAVRAYEQATGAPTTAPSVTPVPTPTG